MITTLNLRQFKQEQKKITMLTCYDAGFAGLLDECGIDILLVGDSLGMVIQGQNSTVAVTLEAMCYHTRAVARGSKNAMIVADLPFGTYETSPQQAFYAASQLLKSGAAMVKLEGGQYQAATTEYLQTRGIPVCAHIGLTPQAVNMLGGYKVQGRDEKTAAELRLAADAHDRAGAAMILMECVPADLASAVTQAVSSPTIGIGAGGGCDGQVLVLYDLLGIYRDRPAKFVKNFMHGQNNIAAAVESYIAAVRAGEFPAAEHCY